jgi:hypothetical protein
MPVRWRAGPRRDDAGEHHAAALGLRTREMKDGGISKSGENGGLLRQNHGGMREWR